MTDSSAAEPMPAWAKAIHDNVEYLIGQLADVETQLADINAQLQTIGDVDEFGHPL